MHEEKARKAIDAAHAKAKELGIAVTVTVVDEHGTLIAASRMDGAIPVSPKFSFAKAYTSAVIGLPTDGIAEYAQPGKPLFGIANALGGKIMIIAGGLPIKHGDKVVGAIGVGGSYDVSQDLACAKAGLEAIKE